MSRSGSGARSPFAAPQQSGVSPTPSNQVTNRNQPHAHQPVSDQEARARGFVFQCTDEEALSAALEAGIGGRLYWLRPDRRQPPRRQPGADHAHAPHAAARPQTGRRSWAAAPPASATRPAGTSPASMMTDEQITAENIDRHPGLASLPLYSFGDGPTDALLLNNAAWLDKLGWIDLLRDVGPHFTINRMLTFDSVKLRLDREQPLTFLEFNYMILQSYDFRELHAPPRRGAADGRLGPVGQHRLRRRADPPHRCASRVLASPRRCITTASGAKMGKSASGADLAPRRSASSAVRVLAVLAQHGGRRRRPLPPPVHRSFHSTRSPASRRCRAPRSTKPRRSLATAVTALAHGKARRRAGGRHCPPRLRGQGEAAANLPTHLVQASEAWPEGIPVRPSPNRIRLGRQQRRSPAPDPRRRRPRQRRGRSRTRPPASSRRPTFATGSVKLSAGRKQHRLIRAG